MEITLTDALAGFAILVSILTFLYTNSLTKRITNKTLRKEYFDEIFLDFMLKTFPNKIMSGVETIYEALNDSSISVDDIVDELDEEIISSLEKAKPYKYINESLYESFYALMSEVQDLIYKEFTLYETKKLSTEEYEQIIYALDNLGKQIYEIMKDEYMC